MSEHIVITGGNRGIGAATALAFAATYPGSRISLVARNEEKLETVAADCHSLGADAQIYVCDLTDENAIASAVDSIRADAPAPSVLLNNAGIFEPGGILETSFASFKRQIAVNLTSAFMMTNSFLPAMLENGSGHIFYMASVAAIKGYPGSTAYCSAKHGLLGLARATRAELLESNIRITTLLPGATYTDSWEGTALPEERFMPAEDIANAVIAAYQMSERTVVEEIVLRPADGDL